MNISDPDTVKSRQQQSVTNLSLSTLSGRRRFEYTNSICGGKNGRKLRMLMSCWFFYAMISVRSISSYCIYERQLGRDRHGHAASLIVFLFAREGFIIAASKRSLLLYIKKSFAVSSETNDETNRRLESNPSNNSGGGKRSSTSNYSRYLRASLHAYITNQSNLQRVQRNHGCGPNYAKN